MCGAVMHYDLLAGYYGIYGALIQGIMKKKVVHYEKKWRQNLTRSPEFCFFPLIRSNFFYRSYDTILTRPSMEIER
jgi:hypothetical protein